MSNENEKKDEKNEEGLTEEELADVTGGAGAVRPGAAAPKVVTTTERLPNGSSAIHIKSLYGGLPGGGSTVIKQQ
ncbi:MAG: hypothetical protein KF819_25480 [Labilithrix sp.]|nr:hypothetical protein [Labilithrix sp.]